MDNRVKCHLELSQYLIKGSQVTVSGSFQFDEWERDGVKHSRPVIIVNDLQLPPQNQSQQPVQQQPQYNEPSMNFDDDIIF